MEDVFKIQSRLASLTVAEVLPLLPPAERGILERRHPTNGAAYRYYLLGRYYWNKRESNGYRQAIEMFQKAAQADPNYAPAYVGLADSYLLDPRPEANLMRVTLPAAQSAIETALRLDPALGEAHATLALIAGSYYFDWTKAEHELQAAIRLSPNYLTAHHWYAEFLTMMGRFEQSEAEFEATRSLDPASAPVLTDLAQLQLFQKRYRQSIRTLDEVLRLNPAFFLAHERKAYSLMLLRRSGEALREFEAADAAGGRSTALWVRAWTQAVAGQRDEALALANLAEAKNESPMMLSVVWAELGDVDRGIDCLERAYEDRSAGMVSLKVNPIFDRLRKSPRFETLLRRMNLTEGR
jgi:tetratricopeptide (TPR) repeat protein